MKSTIALFLYDPKCSVQSGNGIIRALRDHYNFKIFSINELEDGFFDDVDIEFINKLIWFDQFSPDMAKTITGNSDADRTLF